MMGDSPRTIILKPITASDVTSFKTTRLRALEDTPLAFGSTYAKESQLTDADWQQRVDQWNSDRAMAFLAWDGPDPCGIAAGFLDADDPHQAHLVSMWVAPTHRRRGVGQLLVNAVIDWASSVRSQALLLNVTSINSSAIHFYQQLGFTNTGRTEPYPNDASLVEYEMIRAVDRDRSASLP
jgi:ribosomal protein S18 acetylase RimI-like enzyme